MQHRDDAQPNIRMFSYIATVEWQLRGCPHSHFLEWVSETVNDGGMSTTETVLNI
jgi:hypothetical protein